MRSIIVKGLDDELKFSLGTDVEVICAIIERGKALDQITFELEMIGEELIKFIKEFKLDNKVNVDINKNNRYLITAFDW